MASEPNAIPDAPAPDAGQIAEAPDTCYDLCLPLILQGLRDEEPGERQLSAFAKRLDLELAQLKAWLKRAISEGRVKVVNKKVKKSKRRVYTDTSSEEGLPLFDRGDDAA